MHGHTCWMARIVTIPFAMDSSWNCLNAAVEGESASQHTMCAHNQMYARRAPIVTEWSIAARRGSVT